MTLNPGIRPPGGFVFYDDEEFKHEAATFQDLIEAVADYRARLDRPPGNPAQEIEDQICARSPGACFESAKVTSSSGISSGSGAPLQDEATKNRIFVATIQAKLLQWLRTARSKRPPTADTHLAQRRAEICASCPLNADWSKLCPPCYAKAKKLIPGCVDPERPVSGLEGRACLRSKEDLSVSVWMTGPAPLADVPKECWRAVR